MLPLYVCACPCSGKARRRAEVSKVTCPFHQHGCGGEVVVGWGVGAVAGSQGHVDEPCLCTIITQLHHWLIIQARLWEKKQKKIEREKG